MKYHNEKTVVDGHVFDSKLEARRYKELKILEKAGYISDLRLQPDYLLIPRFKKGGRTYRETRYIADFSYFDRESGQIVVEDTKGVKTDVYKLKKKLFEYKYPELTIKEVTR